MEIVDIYDESMKSLGAIPKKEAHLNGAWHKSIHCWIVRRDEKGKEYIVFQKRSATKKAFPNFLDISAAGHYQSGEQKKDGVREITEELGLTIEYEDLHYLGVKFDVYKDENIFNREFCEVFLLEYNNELLDYQIDCDEVTGLVQVEIQAGLDLFSKKKEEITVSGIEYNPTTNHIEEIKIPITRQFFINRIDPYYGKMFMIARAYFNGERDLFI